MQNKDVSIGDENNAVTSSDSELDKSSVDERLKLLQEEDNGAKKEDETFATELDEKVVLPDHKNDDKNSSNNLGKTEDTVTLPDKDAILNLQKLLLLRQNLFKFSSRLHLRKLL